MGGFANVLGEAAGGYAEAAQKETQRQFASEMDRRQQIVGLLGKLAADESAHPEVRNRAFNMALEALHSPHTKQYKPDFNQLIVEQGGQGGTEQASAGPPRSSAGAPAPEAAASPAPQLQAPPKPPSNLYFTPEEQTGQAAARASQVAGSTLTGQVSARTKALEGLELPPEQKAMLSLGTPGMASMMGPSGAGDTLPAAMAAQQGIPLPDDIAQDGWVRVQRNKLGHIVGVFPTAPPAAYAPTTHEGFTYQPQAGGGIAALPVTTTSQKQTPQLAQPPQMPGGSAAPAKPKASVGSSGQRVGTQKPAIMIAPPTVPGGPPRVVAARPGGTVPAGSVTSAGYSSTVVPTSGTRTRAEFAKGLLPHFDTAISDVTRMEKQGKLGPLKGRWNEFLAGKYGSGDPEFSALRTEIGLLQTGMMVPHVGARGGTKLIEKFQGLINSGKMDGPTLVASLKEMRDFLKTYKGEGELKGWGNKDISDSGKFLSRAKLAQSAKDHGVSLAEATRQAEAQGYEIK